MNLEVDSYGAKGVRLWGVEVDSYGAKGVRLWGKVYDYGVRLRSIVTY
jgi:hypothetical protein